MKKLKVVISLIKWLYAEDHPNGVKAIVNRTSDGRSWFMVDQATILIPGNQLDNPYVTVNGKRYVRVGGGQMEGGYIYIGEAEE